MSYNQVPITAIPEVAAYEGAKRQLLTFKQAHPQFFEVLERLVEDHNQCLEAAEKAVRAQAATCGDFELYQRATKIDGKALHDALGREAFLGVGGTVRVATDYKVDAKRLQLAVAQGKVQKDLVDEVTKEEARYHVPKSVSLL